VHTLARACSIRLRFAVKGVVSIEVPRETAGSALFRALGEPWLNENPQPGSGNLYDVLSIAKGDVCPAIAELAIRTRSCPETT
jgi:hypothetical protein